MAYEVISPLIAGVDSLYFSCDLLLSGAMRERLAVEKIIAQGMGKPTPPRVARGMDERFRRVQEVEVQIQMLLGIFAAHRVLPLEFKPAHNVADLLVQHLHQLEEEALEKGSVQQLLAGHFAKVYKVSMLSRAA